MVHYNSIAILGIDFNHPDYFCGSICFIALTNQQTGTNKPILNQNLPGSRQKIKLESFCIIQTLL